MKSDFRFCHRLRVRFAETDLQGIVFNANYMVYYDVAWTEYFRAIGVEYKDFLRMGVDAVLARIQLEFKSPARFDDLLEIYARVSKMGNSSMTFDFEIYPEGEDRLINCASSLYVCIDPQMLKPVRIPEELRSRIAEFEGRAEICAILEEER
jgi:acyl-CoA thioester hydrolase